MENSSYREGKRKKSYILTLYALNKFEDALTVCQELYGISREDLVTEILFDYFTNFDLKEEGGVAVFLKRLYREDVISTHPILRRGPMTDLYKSAEAISLELEDSMRDISLSLYYLDGVRIHGIRVILYFKEYQFKDWSDDE